uniref:BPTI/Kunitz inhibitor domain-containing protein n=1 Tax=Heligmosomoides polygyrus TaxID=6339 RepID=A0A183FXI3_HELPZ
LLVLRIQETLQCDEFWFPGCTTSDTNANLFGDLQSCQKLADMCKGESWACYTFSEIAAAAAAGQILQQFTGFDLNNIGGNFGGLFGG